MPPSDPQPSPPPPPSETPPPESPPITPEPTVVTDYCLSGPPCPWIYRDGEMIRQGDVDGSPPEAQRQAGPRPCEQPTLDISGTTARVTSPVAVSARTGPGRHFPPAYQFAPGDLVTVVCWADGAMVEGSSRWERLSDGNWLPGAYVSSS